MTSTNIGIYTIGVKSNTSPLHSQLGQIGPSTAAWCELRRTTARASNSQTEVVTRSGAVAAFEWSHKPARNAVVHADILWFWTWQMQSCRWKSWVLRICPKIVGYPDQTHLLQLEWKFCSYLRKQRGPIRFHYCPLCSWMLLWSYIKWKEENSGSKMLRGAAV